MFKFGDAAKKAKILGMTSVLLSNPTMVPIYGFFMVKHHGNHEKAVIDSMKLFLTIARDWVGVAPIPATAATAISSAAAAALPLVDTDPAQAFKLMTAALKQGIKDPKTMQELTKFAIKTVAAKGKVNPEDVKKLGETAVKAAAGEQNVAVAQKVLIAAKNKTPPPSVQEKMTEAVAAATSSFRFSPYRCETRKKIRKATSDRAKKVEGHLNYLQELADQMIVEVEDGIAGVGKDDPRINILKDAGITWSAISSGGVTVTRLMALDSVRKKERRGEKIKTSRGATMGSSFNWDDAEKAIDKRFPAWERPTPWWNLVKQIKDKYSASESESMFMSVGRFLLGAPAYQIIGGSARKHTHIKMMLFKFPILDRPSIIGMILRKTGAAKAHMEKAPIIGVISGQDVWFKLSNLWDGTGQTKSKSRKQKFIDRATALGYSNAEIDGFLTLLQHGVVSSVSGFTGVSCGTVRTSGDKRSKGQIQEQRDYVSQLMREGYSMKDAWKKAKKEKSGKRIKTGKRQSMFDFSSQYQDWPKNKPPMAYDMKAKKKVEMQNPQLVRLANGRKALKGTSPLTGVTLFRMI